MQARHSAVLAYRCLNILEYVCWVPPLIYVFILNVDFANTSKNVLVLPEGVSHFIVFLIFFFLNKCANLPTFSYTGGLKVTKKIMLELPYPRPSPLNFRLVVFYYINVDCRYCGPALSPSLLKKNI